MSGGRRPRPGHRAPPSPEGDQGGRVADIGAPCTYCGEDIDFSAGDAGDSQAPVPVSCSHEGFVHARCMLDRAERLVNGHVDPQPRATCRSEWPAGSRPPHPAELTQGLPRSQSEGRWPAVGSTLQFAELLAEGVPRLDSASYVTTGLLQHVRADVEGPREEFNIFILLMLSVQRRSGPAFAGVSRFPPPNGMESSGQPLPYACLLYTSPSPRDKRQSRMPSSA